MTRIKLISRTITGRVVREELTSKLETFTVLRMAETRGVEPDCEVLEGFGQQLGLNVEAGADWCCQEAAFSYFNCTISTTNDTRVTVINLSGKELTGTVPSSIGKLTELEYISVSKNKLGIVLKGVWVLTMGWLY